MATSQREPDDDTDADRDPLTPDVGDRVTLVDAHGQLHEAICCAVHGERTISAVYNDDRDDGVFELDDVDERYDVATSLTPASTLDDPHSYIEGGWSK